MRRRVYLLSKTAHRLSSAPGIAVGRNVRPVMRPGLVVWGGEHDSLAAPVKMEQTRGAKP